MRASSLCACGALAEAAGAAKSTEALTIDQVGREAKAAFFLRLFLTLINCQLPLRLQLVPEVLAAMQKQHQGTETMDRQEAHLALAYFPQQVVLVELAVGKKNLLPLSLHQPLLQHGAGPQVDLRGIHLALPAIRLIGLAEAAGAVVAESAIQTLPLRPEMAERAIHLLHPVAVEPQAHLQNLQMPPTAGTAQHLGWAEAAAGRT